MANIVESIKVSSVNCRGIQTYKKRVDVLNYHKNLNTNILCLQDTHLTNSQERDIRSLWNNPCIIHGISTNSRGVAILFNSNFEFVVQNIETDELGNLLVADLKIANEFTLRIINIYAPNSDDIAFFEKIDNLVELNTCDYVVICGDFNLALNLELDTYNYTNLNHPKSRTRLLKTMSDYNLVDAYRLFYPKMKKFTWFRKNPVKQARLDYFLVSNSFSDLIDTSKINPGYRTDHSIISLVIAPNPFKKGKGLWKFNCSLLKNIQYHAVVKKVITEEITRYAIPVYNPEYLNDFENSEIKMKISYKLFLETILMQIRGKTIKFAAHLKKQEREQEKQLITDIENIENSTNLLQLSDLLEDKKFQLEELRNDNLKGQMIRSRVQWLDEGERPTKYFCSLENKNFTTKTIKKLKLDNDDIVTDQKEILNETKKFYEKLFKNKDHLLSQEKIDKLLQNTSVNKLTDAESNQIEGIITIKELSLALKSMKNNKTPGIDGFPADFYKVFWSKLKFFVLNAINESYNEKAMSISMRQCVISCLPKENKPRELLKNWRPISLLNVTYKLASSCIASRLKSTLNKIISQTQSGFLTSRYIGETSRLVYDLMQYLEHKNIDGLFMLIDFEKAFDSVSWSFLYQILQFFNYGDSIISWIKLFNNGIWATIVQCGHLSDFFHIQRGCRQGDPIASYLFLPCVELLYLLIENNEKVKGILVKTHMFKMVQFADDTTILLDGTQRSLQAALNTLEIFGTLSGLKINKDKTRLVWVGRKRRSRDKLITSPMMSWGHTSFNLLGLEYSVNLNEMIILNYQKYIAQVISILNHWKKRYLTPLGKISVIKTYALSKFIHIFTALPDPPPEIIKKINKIIYKFIWDDKPEKLKRIQINNTYIDGGLKVTNVTKFIKSLKIAWFRRLLSSDKDIPWIKLFEVNISSINKLILLGPLYLEKLSLNTSNKFWCDSLRAWLDLNKISQPNNMNELLHSPLWYNPQVISHPMFIQKWFEKGIHTIGDMLDLNYQVLNMNQIVNKFNTAPIDYLTFHRIKTGVVNILRQFDPIIYNDSDYTQPIWPYYIRIPLQNKKGIKTIYKHLNKNSSTYSNNKWDQDLLITLDKCTWQNAFRICFYTVRDNYLTWMQFKILTRILGCRHLLLRIKITTDENCTFCVNNAETLIHLFCDCQIVRNLWQSLLTWINSILNTNLTLSNFDIIFGYQLRNNHQIPFNSIIMSTKSYIFWCSRKNRKPNIINLQIRLNKMYTEQRLLALNNEQIVDFNKKWIKWSMLFQILND